MRLSFFKQIALFLFRGKESRNNRRNLLKNRKVVSYMQSQWNEFGADDFAFDEQKAWLKIKSKIFEPTNSTLRIHHSVVWPFAATFLVLVGIGLYWLRSDPTPEQDMPMLVYETQHEERLQLILPDSTKVWLNAGSRIEFPESFTSDSRRVSLSGEAYFDVTPRPKQTFIVSTEKLQVQVLGTQFTVSDYQNESTAEAVLVSGKVNVNIAFDDTNHNFELSPNEKLVFSKRQHATTIQAIDAVLYAGWINGRLTFEDSELSYVVGRLEQWYGYKIECPQEIGVSYRLTFTVRNETLDQIIQMIQSAAPIRFLKTNNCYIITK